MVREELSMRNPLNKRLPRELKHDFGKYLVIFLFMVMMISLVSGFLVADNSVKHSYDVFIHSDCITAVSLIFLKIS